MNIKENKQEARQVESLTSLHGPPLTSECDPSFGDLFGLSFSMKPSQPL